MARRLLRRFNTINDYNNEKCELEKYSVSHINNDKITKWWRIMYEFVDLGLPSGTKWATTNVGSCNPEDFGLYFAWGEIEGYSGITSEKGFYYGDYKYTSGACSGSTDLTFRGGLTKYNSKSSSGTVDNLTTLELSDDAAYNSNNTCRMPTYDDFEELIANTTSTWETLNGVNGRRFTSKINGNSIFLPSSGSYHNGSENTIGSYGYYWSSSLYSNNPNYSWIFSFYSSSAYMSYSFRCRGFSIRPVSL